MPSKSLGVEAGADFRVPSNAPQLNSFTMWEVMILVYSIFAWRGPEIVLLRNKPHLEAEPGRLNAGF